jgi:hypothetical protein
MSSSLGLKMINEMGESDMACSSEDDIGARGDAGAGEEACSRPDMLNKQSINDVDKPMHILSSRD